MSIIQKRSGAIYIGFFVENDEKCKDHENDEEDGDDEDDGVTRMTKATLMRTTMPAPQL
jgi:hypothetical protein